jgi:hypothetical protein
MDKHVRFSTLPLSARCKTLSIGLGVMAILSVFLCWKFWSDYRALCVSVHNDLNQTEVIEFYRNTPVHAKPAVAATCLRYIVEFKLPDEYQFPKGKPRTRPAMVNASTNLGRDGFAKVHHMVDIERVAAASDVIACLRRKTGEDLGNDPQRWIESYASTK